jgi:hypothetical protein
MSDRYIPERATRDGSKSLSMATPIWPTENTLNPAWRAFMHFCGELRYGEIERRKIQDGLPVLAEVVKKKVKFSD